MVNEKKKKKLKGNVSKERYLSKLKVSYENPFRLKKKKKYNGKMYCQLSET